MLEFRDIRSIQHCVSSQYVMCVRCCIFLASVSPRVVTRPGQENWQDHWCPAYYPLVGAIEVEKGDTVRLKVTHSELHVMFEVLGVDRHPSGESE